MADTTAMRFIFSGKTDIGKIRKYNEDSFIISSDLKKNRWEFDDAPLTLGEHGALLVLADGAGGVSANGEAISEPVVHTIAEKFRNLQRLPANDAQARQLLQAVMLEAHQTILHKIQQTTVYNNPSSTLMVAWLLEGKAHIAWSGDSRAYLLRNQHVELLTDDHSIVWQLVRQDRLTAEQARTHPDSHILTQCLGNAEFPPHPDALTVRLKEGDRLILTSDGVHSMMKQEDFAAILKYYQTPLDCCKGLIDAANFAGGHDNSTVIVADMTSPKKVRQQAKNPQNHSSIKSDIVKVKALDDQIPLENPKDALVVAALILGFLMVFLFGFVFTNQITGQAEMPDERPKNARFEQIQAQSPQKQIQENENLPLLPEGAPNRAPVQNTVSENNSSEDTTENQADSTTNNASAQALDKTKIQQLQKLLKDILDQKDISHRRINTLKTKTITAESQKIMQEIETDFGKLYPKLKTITNAKSELNEPQDLAQANDTEKVLKETQAILKKIEQNLQKLE